MSTRRVPARFGVALAILVGTPSSFDARADAAPGRSSIVPAGSGVRWPEAAVREEAAFVADINRLRAGRGLAALRVRPNLTDKARRWATTMAGARRIWHSRLSAGVTGNWRRLGENVGVGPTQRGLHAAFAASPTHFENLVDRRFSYVGVGVVLADGLVFVSEMFMEPAGRACRGPGASCRPVQRATRAGRAVPRRSR